MSTTTRPTWIPGDPCICGCGVTASRLLTKPASDGLFHVKGCACRPHTGFRNRKKGQAAQAKMHRALGGVGFTPSNEESARPYILEVCVMPESKTGGQVPASFTKFIDSDWFKHALSQSERAVPAGTEVRPSVCINSRWLVIRL